MSLLTGILNSLRSFKSGGSLLRPPYPPVALQLDRESLSLVRIKHRTRGLPLFEARVSCPLPTECVPASIFEEATGATVDLAELIRGLFEKSGTKPGRASLVIPDNLAKISLVTLPERPASRRQLVELVNSLIRRAIPFRIEDASLSYQILPSEQKGITLLVAVVRRAIVEQYEAALKACGAQLGLVDLCTTNLLNLTRGKMAQVATAGTDVALLNCATNYFSLAIVRGNCLIFFRCKTYAAEEREVGGLSDLLGREVSNSFAYYKERLAGSGVQTLFVRSPAAPLDEIARRLAGAGISDVQAIDPTDYLQFAAGVSLEASAAQQLAPALGAAVGRGR